MIASLAACGSKPQEKPVEPAATKAPEQPAETPAENTPEEQSETAPAYEGTAIIWHTYTDAQQEYLEKAVEEFNATHPGMTVVAESQPYDGFSDKVYQAVIAGNGPDIIIHYASEAAKFLEDGKLVDMERYLDPATVAKLPAPTLAEATSFADGKLHILPIVSSGPIFFYNKAIYDELNLTAPDTWDELVENCKVIKEKYPDKFGFAFDSETDGAATLIMQTGNKMFDAENIYFNTPEVAEQMKFYQDNIAAGYFTNAKVGNYFSEDFNAETLVAYIGSAAGAPYLNIPYGMGKVPQGGAVEWTPAWNRGIIIFDNGDVNRAGVAAAFTDFFAEAEMNAGWCVACNYPALFEDTMETETYKNFAATNESFTYLHPEYAGAFPAVTTQTFARIALRNLMSQVAGGTDVNEALEEAVKYIEDELAAQ